MDRRIEKYLY